jgi:hypothetical protein
LHTPSFRVLLAIALTLAALGRTTPAVAQIANVQSLITKDKPGWTLQLDGSLDFRSWNSQQTVVGASAIGRYVHANHLVLLVARGELVKEQAVPIRERHLEHARYRYSFSHNPLDLEVFAQHSTDVFRRLDNRVLFGGGPRVRILDSSPLTLALGVTPMAEWERIGDGDPADAGLVRLRGRLSCYVMMGLDVGEWLVLRHSVYLQPRLDDWGDLRILNEFEGTVRLNKTFALKWTLVGMQDPRAPRAIVPIDTTIKSSFVVTL